MKQFPEPGVATLRETIWTRLRKMLRRFSRLAGACLLLLVIATVVLKMTVAIGGLSRKIENSISERVHLAVRLQNCDLGLLESSSIQGVEVFESGSGTDSKPWLHLGLVNANITLLSYLCGNDTPKELVVSNSTIILRFDEKGELLTKLPRLETKDEKPLPKVKFTSTEFHLEQQGKPPLIVKNLQGEIYEDEKKVIHLKGNTIDPAWGAWKVQARLLPGETGSDIVLETKEVSLSKETMVGLPFVPALVWDQVKLSGKAAAVIRVVLQERGQGVKYRLDLDAHSAQVRIEPLFFDAVNTRGKVVIEDSLVEIQQAEGQAAGGIIQLDRAALDFRDQLFRMDYALRVNGIQIENLPHQWGLKEKEGKSFLEGILAGWAKLQVFQDKLGAIVTGGTGKGLINKARFLGFPAKPITVELKPEGDRFKIQPGVGPAGLLPPPQNIHSRKTIPTHQDRSWFEGTLEMDYVHAHEVVEKLGLRLPAKLEGSLGFNLRFTAPLEGITHKGEQTAQGKLVLREATFADLDFPEFTASFSLENQEIVLQEARAKVRGPAHNGKREIGDLVFAGRWNMEEQGQARFRLQAAGLPLALFSPFLPENARPSQGAISAGADFKFVVASMNKPETWIGVLGFRIDQLHWHQIYFPTLGGNAALEAGRMEITALDGPCQIGRVSGSGQVQLVKGMPFHVQLKAAGLDLAALQSLMEKDAIPFPIEGGGQATLNIHGQADPPKYQMEGDLDLPLAKLGQVRLENSLIHWRWDEGKLALENGRGKIFNGKWEGAATLPLADDKDGKIELRLKDLEANSLMKSFLDKALPVTGKLGGTFAFSLSKRNQQKERDFNLLADLDSSGYEIWGIPFGRTKLAFDWKAKTLTGKLETRMADGQGRLDLFVPPLGGAGKIKAKGNFRLENAQLKHALQAAETGEPFKSLNAVCHIDLPFEIDLDTLIFSGSGKISFWNLRHGTHIFGDQFHGNLALGRDSIEIRDILGNLADGQLRSFLHLNFDNFDKSYFRASLQKADISKLTAPWLAAWKPAGRTDVRLQGKIGREYSATGEAVTFNSRLQGFDIGDWRFPIDLMVAPARGVGTFQMRDITGLVAQGKVTGTTTYKWGVGNSLAGDFRFFGVELRPLLVQLGDSSPKASGTLHGKVHFTGIDVNSLVDLAGNIEAGLVQSRAQGIPVIRDLAPLLPVATLASSFDKGELKARLDRGIVRVQRLALSNSLVMLLVEGKMTLQGKLDLEATARTGNIASVQENLRASGMKFQAVGAIPLEIITQVTNLLATGLFHFRITGTWRNPVIRSVSLTILTEEATRFFLGRP